MDENDDDDVGVGVVGEDKKEIVGINPNDVRHSSKNIEKDLLGEKQKEEEVGVDVKDGDGIKLLQPPPPPPPPSSQSPNTIVYLPYYEATWSKVAAFEVGLLVILYFCCLSIYTYPFISFIFLVFLAIIKIINQNKYHHHHHQHKAM